MSRIDHAAEAKAILTKLTKPGVTDGMTGSAVIASVISAQAHATLAGVEQARIANLTALATLSGEYDENTDLLRIEAVASLVEWVPHGLDDEHPEIRPEIAAALGIESATTAPIPHTDPCPWIAVDDEDQTAIEWTDGDHVLYCASHEQARDVIDAVAGVMGWAVSDA